MNVRIVGPVSDVTLHTADLDDMRIDSHRPGLVVPEIPSKRVRARQVGGCCVYGNHAHSLDR